MKHGLVSTRNRLWPLAGEIAAAFRAGETYYRLSRKHRCAYQTLQAILHATIPYAEYEAIIRATRIRANRPTRFRKGHVPWSKGMKGLRLSPATEFKRGCLRGYAARQWRPVGTVVIRTNKARRGRPGEGGGRRHTYHQRWIKVTDDPRVRSNRRWRTLAEVLWERDHGPLPAGWCVTHADGDSLHDEPSNLVAMSRSAWLSVMRRDIPGFEERRRQGAARAAGLRRGVARRVKEAQGEHRPRAAIAGFVAAVECVACGYTVPEGKAGLRCPKCRCAAWQRASVLADGAGRPVLGAAHADPGDDLAEEEVMEPREEAAA